MVGPESGARPSQGELNIDVPKGTKELSTQEFAALAYKSLREYATKSIATFYQTIRDGFGKEILGTVPESGSETEIALESGSEHMFVNTCDTNKLPLYIIGEHHTYKTPLSNGIDPKHIAFSDALDNTREYEQGEQGHQGLPAPLWSVASIYTLEGQPVAGVIANLKEKKVYVSEDGKNTLLDLETGKEEEIKPSERISIKDRKFCLATYLGDPGYALSFYENFSGVAQELKRINNDAVLQPHTGSFIFGPMAEGNVDAYLMAREPIREQLPGWVFAQTSGFTAWEINPKEGTYKEIEHDLNRFKNDPTEYRRGKMLCYLVTRSNQVRDEIIALIVDDYKKNELKKAKIAFADSHPEEFEVFRSTRQAQNPPTN